ncbi:MULTISPECIES: LytTR family DNA-binding domain-containing protein [unclassified Thioalkalivibrio]|uniref:LytR/AlgR family response regulator transcription factor n=1 Tax=unclassified Thioalkalivibrio TaxID=2621013 RepID=UPI0003622DAD|nr:MULTISPECIES: LytTR family DNA-binding domain-containing protein [unclassified Thioalkalivibrio]
MELLIADDEPVARERLRDLVTELGHRVVAEAADAGQVRTALQTHRPGALLLDIEMPGERGIELAGELARSHPELVVILVTAHEAFGLQAFEAGVRDYVLKPVRRERLEQALERARQSTAGSAQPDDPPAIRLRIGRREESVQLDAIDCFVTEDGCVVARGRDLEGFVEARLQDLEQALGDEVLRVHRGALAVARNVAGLETRNAGDHRLRFRDGREPVPVSRRQLARVREFLRRHTRV